MRPIGDEAIVNFNGPAFEYNGRTYTRFGVDSNGYVVVGGGTVEDNECCTLPAGPDPARPNTILAPFWTDLDGTGAPGILVGVLTDGADDWLVVEWRVNVFGTTDQRRFQVWIGLADDADPEQDITFAYAAPQADPAGQDFLVGAENELGEGDVSSFLPTADQRVTSSPATPGGSASYVVVARRADRDRRGDHRDVQRRRARHHRGAQRGGGHQALRPRRRPSVPAGDARAPSRATRLEKTFQKMWRSVRATRSFPGARAGTSSARAGSTICGR